MSCDQELDFETKHVLNVYNSIAEDFDRTRGYYWPGVKKFIKSLDISPEKTILDLGCGNGRYTPLMEGMQIYSLDNSSELLKIVKSKYPFVHLIEADATNTGLPNNMFDYLISIAVIHHLVSEERRVQFIQEIYRVMKISGLVMISAWATTTNTSKFIHLQDSDYLIPWAHKFNRFYHLFEENEFEDLLEKSELSGKLIIREKLFECDNHGIILEKIE